MKRDAAANARGAWPAAGGDDCRTGSRRRVNGVSADRGHDPVVRDFEERRTRAQAEREAIPELFRLSVSYWLQHEQAAARSLRRRFHIAEVRLETGTLARVALTEDHGEGHVDVWASGQELLAGIVNVVRGFRRA